MLNEPFIKFQLGSEARNNVFTNIMICCNIRSHVFATSPLNNFPEYHFHEKIGITENDSFSRIAFACNTRN